MKPTLLKTENGYDFYSLTTQLHDSNVADSRTWWNIVPEGSDAPEGGYGSKGYIEHIKHQSFA